jgi:hypothetical protein
MKNILSKRITGVAMASAAVLFASVATSHATSPQPDLNYFVILNVSSLIGNGNGPFSLDLQLAPGSDNVTNTVTLTNFSFVGGSVSATPNFTMGGESGSMTSTLTLTNSNNINNEFAAAFSAGVTQISFFVDQTVNPETGPSPAPDQFNVFIDDNTGSFIPTNDPSGNSLLATSTIIEGESMGDVQTFSSASPDGGVATTVSSVPEPGSAAMLLIGAVGLVWRRNRRATVQSA